MRIVSEPVDMIAKFASSGSRASKSEEKPVPCKFRYTDIAGISREIRIDKIISADLSISGGVRAYIYRCQSVVENVEKIYELTYIIGECRWELYKI